ncbi:hypothetical protein [Parapedobacter sp. DT-150]|uniref:hypothetical protein n=1 Tax=Parapedobacter sp. DT-150 TaxID=3396162 RepID=UPI003F1B1203
MLKHYETLDGQLRAIESHLAPIAEAARRLVESGLLEDLAAHLPEIILFVRQHFRVEEPRLFMPDVLDYLGISERTYYRKVAGGRLIPRKWEGPDFFYRSDLEEQRRESRRRGRI